MLLNCINFLLRFIHFRESVCELEEEQREREKESRLTAEHRAPIQADLTTLGSCPELNPRA